MFCTTIIPTVGRPTLARTVNSVLQQCFSAAPFEVIVVNDSGRPLPRAPWQKAARVRVVATNQLERSVARNTGAALAQGRYLHFLDDDDWLLPTALADFWQYTQHHHADWICGGTRLVDRDDNPIVELHHRLSGNHFSLAMAGEWIPLQSSLIRAVSFFRVGAFNTDLDVGEDIDLTRRIALQGKLGSVPETVVCIEVGEEGSTTNRQLLFRHSLQARELILNRPGVWSRLRQSADDSYWQGRIARLYLTSMVWNISHRRLFSAASRAVWGIVSMALAAPHLLSRQYWRALLFAYQSKILAQGFAARDSLGFQEFVELDVRRDVSGVGTPPKRRRS